MVAGERRGWCQDLGKWGGTERESVCVALQGRETSSSPASVCLGDEEAQCRSKRHCFVLPLSLFFLKQSMTRHLFSPNMPFHLKGKGTKTC